MYLLWFHFGGLSVYIFCKHFPFLIIKNHWENFNQAWLRASLNEDYLLKWSTGPLILKLLQKVNQIAVFLYSYTGKSDPDADIWGKARKAPRPVEDMRSVTLVVYGKDVNQIKRAIRIIEEDVDNTFKSKVYSESIIKQFSTSQVNETYFSLLNFCYENIKKGN